MEFLKCSLNGNQKKRTKNQGNKKKMVSKMTDFNPIILVITLNVNSLTIPVKRQKLTNQIKKQDLMIGCLQEISFKDKDR